MIDLFGIAEDGLRETLDPSIWIEPKDRGSADEDTRQAEFVAWMRKNARACRVIAIPNAGRRTRWEAAKRKREGMVAGEPDTVITWTDASSVRIEFKNGREMPNENQISALNWYHRRGHPVAICRTAEGAIGWLRSVGAPV